MPRYELASEGRPPKLLTRRVRIISARIMTPRETSTSSNLTKMLPPLELAQNYGLSEARLNTALKLIREHEDEFRVALKKHFGR